MFNLQKMRRRPSKTSIREEAMLAVIKDKQAEIDKYKEECSRLVNKYEPGLQALNCAKQMQDTSNHYIRNAGVNKFKADTQKPGIVTPEMFEKEMQEKRIVLRAEKALKDKMAEISDKINGRKIEISYLLKSPEEQSKDEKKNRVDIDYLLVNLDDLAKRFDRHCNADRQAHTQLRKRIASAKN